VKRYCLALDLKDDPQLIAEYKRHHENVWPEIKASIVSAGVLDMEIYLIGNRLFMIMETEDSFSFAAKAALDAANKKVQEWERLMWRYQTALPQADEGGKWTLMERVFSLKQG
jgi:L-rhamnose mutarotase